MPENTIAAFTACLDLDVNYLELDVVISKDKQVVVSHEPFMSADICLFPNGSAIPEDTAHQLNLYQMDYAEIKTYDCGSKPHPRFPDQVKMNVPKPLLSEVFTEVQRKAGKGKVKYNIELKSQAQYDNVYHPAP